MTIKSKLLTHISGSISNPEKWSDLSTKEKEQARLVTTTYIGSAFAIAACALLELHTVQNTPKGCAAILFPEQTWIKQPEKCRKPHRPLYGLGFGISATVSSQPR